MTRSKVKVTSSSKLEIRPLSKAVSTAIYSGSWQMTTDAYTRAQYLILIGLHFWYSAYFSCHCHVTLKLAETSVLKSRPSVPYGANLYFILFIYLNQCWIKCWIVFFQWLKQLMRYFTENKYVKHVTSSFLYVFQSKNRRLRQLSFCQFQLVAFVSLFILSHLSVANRVVMPLPDMIPLVCVKRWEEKLDIWYFNQAKLNNINYISQHVHERFRNNSDKAINEANASSTNIQCVNYAVLSKRSLYRVPTYNSH